MVIMDVNDECVLADVFIIEKKCANVYDTSKIVKGGRKCNFRRPNFVEGT